MLDKKAMKFYICTIFSMYYLRLFINWRLTSLYPTDTFNKSPSRIASLQKKLEKFTSNRYDTALYRLNKELYDQYVKYVRSSKTVINVTIDFTLRIILEIVSCLKKLAVFLVLKHKFLKLKEWSDRNDKIKRLGKFHKYILL